MVALSTSDDTSRVKRPLADEIDIPPSSTIRKNEYILDKKRVPNTNVRKPWSNYRMAMVTSLPARHAPYRPKSTNCRIFNSQENRNSLVNGTL
jgi:hypothetical protein